MKRLTIFETTIIGLFVGVMMSAYVTFVIGTDGFLGMILGTLSLKPLLDMLKLPDNLTLLTSFLFFIVVYSLYGTLFGLISRVSPKVRLLLIPAALLLATGIIVEQKQGSVTAPSTNQTYQDVAAVAMTNIKKPKQYFGTEATGDLNGDGRSDVAFLIHRNDKKIGPLYYLSSALSTESGRSGTNMLYLGSEAEPKAISITEGIILVEYVEKASDLSNVERFYAKVVDGVLAETLLVPEASTTTVSSLSPF